MGFVITPMVVTAASGQPLEEGEPVYLTWKLVSFIWLIPYLQAFLSIRC